VPLSRTSLYESRGDSEFRAAYMRSKAGPPQASTLNEVLRLIAGFGGFPARKNDGEPGVQTI